MPGIIESYLTVPVHSVWGPQEIKEKGSRFISYLYPVQTITEAEAVINALWKKYHDATHVCFAFRLGEGREMYFRSSDDGEPSGTAGIPILNEIKSKDFFNVIVAVVRYFGGTKLGTGGLVRAYSASARRVIETIKPVTIDIKKEGVIVFPYELTGEIMPLVQRYNLEIRGQEYTDSGVSMVIGIPIARVEEVGRAVTDASSGRLHLEMKCLG